MHLADFDFVVRDGETYCTDCVRDTDGEPIFAGSEWETAPVCAECGAVCDTVTILDKCDTFEARAVRAFTDVDWAHEDRMCGGVDPDWYRE